jgi:hypothetical protein
MKIFFLLSLVVEVGDDVAAPEPASWALAVIGLVMLGIGSRHVRRKAL